MQHRYSLSAAESATGRPTGLRLRRAAGQAALGCLDESRHPLREPQSAQGRVSLLRQRIQVKRRDIPNSFVCSSSWRHHWLS